MTTYSLYMTSVSMSVIALLPGSDWEYAVWQLAADPACINLTHAPLRTTSVTLHLSHNEPHLAHIWGADHNI